MAPSVLSIELRYSYRYKKEEQKHYTSMRVTILEFLHPVSNTTCTFSISAYTFYHHYYLLHMHTHLGNSSDPHT